MHYQHIFPDHKRLHIYIKSISAWNWPTLFSVSTNLLQVINEIYECRGRHIGRKHMRHYYFKRCGTLLGRDKKRVTAFCWVIYYVEAILYLKKTTLFRVISVLLVLTLTNCSEVWMKFKNNLDNNIILFNHSIHPYNVGQSLGWNSTRQFYWSSFIYYFYWW